MMKVAMIGSGYVGLVSGACFADFGYEVCCIDKNAKKIEALKSGTIPIFEPGLDELVKENVSRGRLTFTNELHGPVSKSDVVFIAVGTPARRGDGHADLSYVHAAAREIAQLLSGYTVVVTKSTVPVGTGDEIERIIREECADANFDVVSNPEFLREGAAIEDFKRPDRIVIGATSNQAADIMRELYRPLYLNQAPILVTGRRTAELTKYAANAFLATKITFINEIADLCEKVGANVQDVARGIGLDKRIGSKFLHAGPGYGGSCFPKDTLALIKTAEDAEAPVKIVETVARVNDQRKRSMGRKIIQACGGDIRGKRIAVLGLTFKPNTDDMRDAPSLAIIRALQDAGANVVATDPKGLAEAQQILENVVFAEDPYLCAEGADAAVIVTEWDAYRALELKRLCARMKVPVLIDLRNVYEPDEATNAGMRYFGVGQ